MKGTSQTALNTHWLISCEGARKIFTRSVDKYKLRYSTVISDGDSKTVSTLNREEVYGEVQIKKHECVGHNTEKGYNKPEKSEIKCIHALH